MVRVAPVTLAFNPKVLWFEAGDLVLNPQDKVVVSTARGTELGTMMGEVFEASEESVKNLATPLKPVKRLATDYDIDQAKKMERKAGEAMALFRRLVEENEVEMNPVSVEYLLDGDKAVFYFESEDRVDFRELVRSLAAELHIRIDMRQIGVRDEARMIGGLSHCGQELCCKRLGGEFNPVTIRMAKEQNLSLNPQKISGVCGRLMCCLRYEYEAYHDFNGRAPKMKAKVKTPDGVATVVELDAVREVVSLQISDERPVRVPLADFDKPQGEGRPDSVGVKAWEKAHDVALFGSTNPISFFSGSPLHGADQVADPRRVVRREEAKDSEGRQSRASRSDARKGAKAACSQTPASAPAVHVRKRRRSTMLAFDGDAASEGKTDQTRDAKSAEHSPSASRITVRKRTASDSQENASANRNGAVRRTRETKKAQEGASLAAKQHAGAKAPLASKAGADKQAGGSRPQRPSKQKGKGSSARKAEGASLQEESQASSTPPRPGRRSSGLRQNQNLNQGHGRPAAAHDAKKESASSQLAKTQKNASMKKARGEAGEGKEQKEGRKRRPRNRKDRSAASTDAPKE